jgi:hypothetical protein
MVWPHPVTTPLRIVPTGCHLELPDLAEGAPELPAPFGPVEYAVPLAREGARSERRRWVEREGATSVMRERELSEATLADGGVYLREENRGWWRIDDDDPLSAACEFVRDYAVERQSVRARVVCRASMTADADAFHVREDLEVFSEGECIHRFGRDHTFARQLC